MIKIEFHPNETRKLPRKNVQAALQQRIQERIMQRRMTEIQQVSASNARTEFRKRLSTFNEQTEDSTGKGGSLLNPPLNQSPALATCCP